MNNHELVLGNITPEDITFAQLQWIKFGQGFQVLLNRVPTSTQLDPPPTISLQPPPSFLQHPQRY